MGLRDNLKAASVTEAKTRTRIVTVPGGDVEVRGLMSGDKIRVGEEQNAHGGRRALSLLVALCSFDPATGRPIWSANDGGDLEEVANLDSSIFDPLKEAGLELSGLADEGAEGNAPSSATGSSSTSSPATSGGARSKSGAK